MTIKESYTINDLWIKPDSTSNTYSGYVSSNYLRSLLPDIEKSTRKNPTALGFPNQIDFTSKIHFPSKWQIDPENYTLDRNAYFCDMTYNYNSLDSTLTQHFSFYSKQDNIAVGQSAEYMADYKKISDSSGYDYTWNGQSTEETTDRQSIWFAIVVFVILLINILRLYLK